MGGLELILGTLREGAAEVLAEFGEITRGEPWLCLPQQYTLDSLPALLGALAESALGDGDATAARRRKVWTAAVHGEHRLQHGFPEQLIFTEYQLLRQAVWRVLRRRFPDHPRLADAINRIDAGISLSTMASLRGYHRAALEAQNRWPEAIECLADGWPGFDRNHAATLNPRNVAEPHA